MVAEIACGLFIFIIGFGAGRLSVHSYRAKPNTHQRFRGKLTTEQFSNILFGIYVGLVVSAIQKTIEGIDSAHDSLVAALLSGLSILVAILICFLFPNRANEKDESARNL